MTKRIWYCMTVKYQIWGKDVSLRNTFDSSVTKTFLPKRYNTLSRIIEHDKMVENARNLPIDWTNSKFLSTNAWE